MLGVDDLLRSRKIEAWEDLTEEHRQAFKDMQAIIALSQQGSPAQMLALDAETGPTSHYQPNAYILLR